MNSFSLKQYYNDIPLQIEKECKQCSVYEDEHEIMIIERKLLKCRCGAGHFPGWYIFSKDVIK